MTTFDQQDNTPSLTLHNSTFLGSPRDSGDDHWAEATVNSSATFEDGTIPSTSLHRSPYVLVLTLGYGIMAILSWIVILVLMYKPIGTESYLPNYTSESFDWWDIETQFSMTEYYLRAARMLQAVVSILTIPLTSTVCSSAAVVFLQRRRRGQGGPTLRQSMTLADKCWADPIVIIKLVSGQWKKYGSSLLLVAIVLNILGKYS